MHTWILVCLISWFTYACCLWGSFYRREKNRGKVPQGLGVVGVLYSTTCVSYYRHTTTTKHAAAALTIAHNQPHHDESVLAAVLPTHANRRASSDGAGRAPPTDASRLAWVGRNGCQNPSVRAAMWGRRAPSLSLVEFHFIVRLYYVYVINLYINFILITSSSTFTYWHVTFYILLITHVYTSVLTFILLFLWIYIL